jgi:hypothetical protein
MTTCEELDDIHMDTIRVANALYREVAPQPTDLKKLALLRQVTIGFTVKLQAVLISEGFTISIGSGWSDWEYRHDLCVILSRVSHINRLYQIVITIHPNQPTLIYSQGPPYLGTIHNLINDIRVARDKRCMYDHCNTCHYSNDMGQYCGQGLEMYTGNCHKRLPTIEQMPI